MLKVMVISKRLGSFRKKRKRSKGPAPPFALHSTLPSLPLCLSVCLSICRMMSQLFPPCVVEWKWNCYSTNMCQQVVNQWCQIHRDTIGKTNYFLSLSLFLYLSYTYTYINTHIILISQRLIIFTQCQTELIR